MILFYTKETNNETTKKCHYELVRMAKIRRLAITSSEEYYPGHDLIWPSKLSRDFSVT